MLQAARSGPLQIQSAGNGGNISQTGLLSTGTNAVEAVAVPKQCPDSPELLKMPYTSDFSNGGTIYKITKASTAPERSDSGS